MAEAGARAAAVVEAHASLMARYRRELAERRRLFNLVQELRGNIRVLARVRPPVGAAELSGGGGGGGGAELATSFPPAGAEEGPGGGELLTVANNKQQVKSWEFDRVFRPGAANEEVFREVEGLVTSVLDGFNVCIFAYGQTGSGKTHTMEGSRESPGINYRTLDALFALRAARAGDARCDISVSLLEIYNEQIFDLMAPRGAAGPAALALRDGGNGVTVQDLSAAPAQSSEEVLALMAAAYRNRATFATNMNEHSSRSHCVLTVQCACAHRVTGTRSLGRLNLIDLAGSERVGKSGATGDRLKEAQAINKSLSALGDVIQARAERQKHVPFRNSVLTHLLADSLSGDSKTLMIVNASPALASAEETYCSLNFASRVRSVELGQAKRHVVAAAGAAGGGAPGSPAGGR